MSDIGQAFGDIGGAVSDLFGAEGSNKAASSYKKAAQIAETNEELTQRSTKLQVQQQDIQTYKVLGTEAADVSAAGFTQGGSAGDLMRASAQQAALSKQLTENQGEITAEGYEQQAQGYLAQAGAASTAAKGQGAGGVLNAVAGVASVVGWVICTELMKQNRMSKRAYYGAANQFFTYPEAVREGYYVWAIPSVRHLRAHPHSFYSCFLETIFKWRAENISGVRKSWRGAAVTVVLWPLCYAIGAVRLAMKRKSDWGVLYSAQH